MANARRKLKDKGRAVQEETKRRSEPKGKSSTQTASVVNAARQAAQTVTRKAGNTPQGQKARAQSATSRVKSRVREGGARQQTLSKHDRKLDQQSREGIQYAKQDYDSASRRYEAAKAKGDKAAMNQAEKERREAHRRAEEIRRTQGGYSGGRTGDEYITPELSKQDKAHLTQEGQALLRAAKLGYGNSWNDTDRARFAAEGQAIRENPAYMVQPQGEAYRNIDANGRMVYGGTPEERKQEAEQLGAILPAIGTGIAGSFASIPEVTRQALQTDASRNNPLLRAVSEARGGGDVNIPLPKAPTEETLGQKLLRESREYTEKATKGQAGLDRYLTQALITGGEMIPGLVTTAATGGATLPGLAVMGMQAAGQKMGDLNAQGVDPVEAFNRGVVAGGIEAGSEAIPLRNLLKIAKGGGKSFARNMLTQALEEVGTEEASEIGNYLADKAFRDPEASLTKQDLIDTAAISALTSLGMGAGAGMIGNAKLPQMPRQEVTTNPLIRAAQERKPRQEAKSAINVPTSFTQQQTTTAALDQLTPTAEALNQQDAAIQARMQALNAKEKALTDQLRQRASDPMLFKEVQEQLAQLDRERQQLRNDMVGFEIQRAQRADVDQRKQAEAKEAARAAAGQAMQTVTSTSYPAGQVTTAYNAAQQATGLPVANPAAEQVTEPAAPQEAAQSQEMPRMTSVQYGQPENHIDNRQSEDLGNRNVKAFQWDHPEIKPYYQRAAEALKADAEYSDATRQNVRGSKKDQALGRKLGTVMQRNDALNRLHSMGLSTSEIIKACDAIINDQGQENYAAAKRVELALNDMLSKGYTPVEANRDPNAFVGPDADYLRIKGEISGGVAPGSWEAYRQDHDFLVETGEVTEDELRAEWEAEQAQKNPPEAESTAVNTDPAQHTPAEQAVIDEYQDSTDEALKEVFADFLADPNQKFARHNISSVSERQAGDVARLVGGQYTGYQNAINTNGIRHILNRHGPNGEADQSLGDLNDVARIGYVLDNYDNVVIARKEDGTPDVSTEFMTSDNRPAPKLIFTKKVNGTYYVVEAVPESKYKKFWVISAYMNAAEGITQAPDARNPETTSETALASLSSAGTSIPQAEVESNRENVDERYSVGAAPSGFDQMSHMANEYGTIEPGENPARIVDVPRSTNGTDVVSKSARTFLEAQLTSDPTQRQIEREIVNSYLSHDVKGLDETMERAYNLMDYAGIEGALKRWDDVVSGRKKPSEDDIALGIALWANAERTGNSELAGKLVAEIAAEQLTSGRMVNLSRMIKRMTPEGRTFYLRRSLENIKDELRQIRKGKRSQKAIDNLTLDEGLLETYRNAPTQEEADAALDKIWDDIARQLPRTFWDVATAWRYFAMLGNPRTHVKNVVGNALKGLLDSTSGELSALLQKSLPQDQRTRTVGGATKAAKEFAKQDYLRMKDVLKGGKYTSNMGALQRKIQERALGPLSKATTATLEWEDLQAKKIVYRRSLAEYITAKGWDPNNLALTQLEEARSHAIRDAQIATFTEENALASLLNRLEPKNALTRVAIGSAVPFKGVPMNVVKAAAAYSPFNAAVRAKEWRDLRKQLDDVPTGKRSAAEVIDSFSRGMTGTAIAGIGALLAAKGILTTGGDDDDAFSELETARGSQNYALKIGDVTYTLDWAAPSTVPLFLGAELYNGVRDIMEVPSVESEDDEAGNVDKLVQAAEGTVNALSRMFDPLLDTTMLSGVSGMTNAVTYGDHPISSIVGYLARNFAAQFVPTAAGSLARTIDDTRRTTFVDKNNPLPPSIQRFIQQQENKIPGLSQKNMPYMDVWGREDKQENVGLRILQNFASPGYFKQVDHSGASEVTDELERLYNAGYEGVIPKKPTSKMEGRYLNQEETEARTKAQGQTALDYLIQASQGDSYKDLTDEEKAEYVRKILDYSKWKGNAAAGSEKTESWIAKANDLAEQSGIGISALLEAAGVAEAIGSHEDKSDIANLLDFNKYLEEKGYDDNQQFDIKKAFYSSNDVTRDYADAVKDGKITQDQAEQFVAKVQELYPDADGSISQDQTVVALREMGVPYDEARAIYEARGWATDYDKAVKDEKKNAELRAYYQSVLPDVSEAKINAFLTACNRVGGCSSMGLHQFFNLLDSMGIPENERPGYYAIAQSQRARPWKRDYYAAKKYVA